MRKPAYALAATRENRHRYDEARQARQSLQTDPIGYSDSVNLYAYAFNDPMNSTDPTGLCVNDPLCEGEWSDANGAASPGQSGVGLQNAYHWGDGATYTADPQQFGLDEAIDIGTQIQNSVNSGGFYGDIASQANESGAAVRFARDQPHGFNGESGAGLSRESARSIGRFAGSVEGTMSVADGAYTVQGTMTLSDNPYSWAPDNQGDPLSNAAIGIIGNLPSRVLPAPGGPGGPGVRVIMRNDGTPVPMQFNRTYSFTARGRLP